MSEWIAAFKKKAHEAPYLLPKKDYLQQEEDQAPENNRFLPSPIKDIVIPKGFEAREEGLYFVPSHEEKPQRKKSLLLCGGNRMKTVF